MHPPEAIDVLRQWYTVDRTSLDRAATIVIDHLGGETWLSTRMGMFNDRDDVFHARGMALAAGYQPNVSVRYKDAVLWIDEERVRILWLAIQTSE